MSALSVYDLADLQAAETTWHIPAVFGAIAGGIAMHLYLERGPRAKGMSLSGLSMYGSRRRKRGSSRRGRCTRFKRVRVRGGGVQRRCASYA